MLKNKNYLWFILAVIIIITCLTCAPGNYRWDPNIEGSKPAGFWAGLWHGIIVVITFIISLFTNTVKIYEINNTGWPYNLGFVLGLFVSIGGGVKIQKSRRPKKYEWQALEDKIEEKIREGVKAWVEESENEEKKKEWEEIGKKIEEKIKRKLKEWAEKE